VAAPSISYDGSPYYWPGDEQMTAASPTNQGGAVDAYTVQSGALPSGVDLNALTGELTGTPTDEGTSPVTIRATGAGGTSDAEIAFTSWAPWWDAPADARIWNPAAASCLDGADEQCSDGEGVKTWTERGGSGFDFTQATEAERPLWRADIDGNGNPGLEFDGTKDMANTLGSDQVPNHMLFLAAYTNLSGYKAVIGTAGSGGMLVRAANATVQLLKSQVALIGSSSQALSGTDPIWHEVTYAVDGAYTFRTGGSDGGGGTNLQTFGNVRYLGSDKGTHLFNGSVLLVLEYAGAFSGTFLTKMRAYITGKYGVSA